jgi:SAM-dependent methyltransferase
MRLSSLSGMEGGEMTHVQGQRIDYDAIAERYDHERLRSKQVDPDLLDFVARYSAREREALAILDIGCGTGSQLAADRAILPAASMVGLDLFDGMLRQAQRKRGDVGWVRGDGAGLPFAAASFHFASSQFSFHHVQDKRSMIGEVYRVLRPGGRFVMTNIAPREMPGWALYGYFPACWERDLADFCPWETIQALLLEAGFEQVEVTLSHSKSEECLSELAQGVRLRVTSQLVALPDEAYRAGLERFESALRRARGRVVKVPTETCLIKVVGDKGA